MKKLLFTFALLLVFVSVNAQDAEAEIRKLEEEAKEAIFKKDTVAFSKLYAPGFVVNSPANKIETFQEVLVRMRSGGIDRSRFEKNIEKITFADNVAIVMGNEIVVPKGRAANAGMTTKRRYTNIWVKTKDSWQLIARQSTIISME